MSGDDGDLWEFVSSKVSCRINLEDRAHVQSVPKPTNSLFELTVLNCIYERVSRPDKIN